VTSVESKEHERAQRVRLAAAIERRKDEIETRWVATMFGQLEGRPIELTELRNAMPDYLAALVQTLREDEGTIEQSGAMAWAAVAREHALTRVRLGFDIQELVREFIALRRILFDIAREEGVFADERQTSRLADLVESAVAEAVKSYVDSRDYAARRLEAEHVAFVTHELRNPLTTADIVASRLRKQLTLTPAQDREFGLLMRSLERLHQLVDSVLLVEQYNANEVKPHSRETTLGEIVEVPLESARATAAAKNLVLEVEIPQEAFVYADADLTRSVFGNLLDNAMKYTDEGVVRLVATETPRDVVVHVFDNCEGISAEELKTIFEPFRRGKHSRKPGTGLGLAIARRAVEAQGGTIAAESATERGCHFWFTLPKSPPRPPVS
jgi:signal transduction histidine kinase